MSCPEDDMVPCAYRLPWSTRGLAAGDHYRVEIVATRFDGGKPSSWAVREVGMCLTREGQWEWEPQTSSRTDEFLNRARWGTAVEAYKAAEKWFMGGGRLVN